jgi:hypothetical protein
MYIPPNTGLWEVISGGFASGPHPFQSYATGHYRFDRAWVNSGGASGTPADQGLVFTTGHEGWNGPPLKYKYNLDSCDLGGCDPADTDRSIVKVSFWVCWALAGQEFFGEIPDGYFGDEIAFLDSAGNVGFMIGLTQRATGDTVTYWDGAALFESAIVGSGNPSAPQDGKYDYWEITLDLVANTVSAVFTPISTGIPNPVVTNQPMMSPGMVNFSAMTFRTSPGVGANKLMSVDDFIFETDCNDEPCAAEIVEVYCVPDFDNPDDPTDLFKKVVATIKVTNNSGIDATEIRITPIQTGIPVIATPQQLLQNVSGDGGMHTFDVMFENLIDGEEFCFVVTLVDATGNACCSTVVCFTPDCDCLQIRDANEYILCSPDGVSGKYIYTFQFDNLRPETIHHIYFPPNSGVTPGYIQLNPPVLPGATSQPIMVEINGASPGVPFCFDLDIHDELLNQCCRQEICVDIPFCGDKGPRGACCFEQPGLPQSGCIVTTDADCIQTYNGVYLGDNTTCNPNPCIPDAGDTTTHLTAFARCCWPQNDFATTTLTICNNSAIARSYMWSLASVVGAGCPFAIDPAYINPNMGNVTLLPGDCIAIDVLITCEVTLGNMGVTCLEATVTDLTSNTVHIAMGKVTTDIVEPGGDITPWYICGFDPFNPTIAYPPDLPYITGAFQLTNNTKFAETFSYLVNGGGTLSINGQPSGIPTHSFVRVEPGQTVFIFYGVSLTEDRPMELFDAVLYSDLDGDGEFEPLISQAYQSASGEPCPGDLNGDGVINFSDLNAVLTCFGVSGAPCLGSDVDNDGQVDFADLNIILSNFGTGCN